jgi:hypothetical protein
MGWCARQLRGTRAPGMVPIRAEFPIPVPERCRDAGKRNWELDGCDGHAFSVGPLRTISIRPEPRKHAIVLAAVKDKPSAALKKRRP